MGREIRRVPPNWQHPMVDRFDPYTRQTEKEYIPMYDQSYIEAINEWINGHLLWEKGEHPVQKADRNPGYRYYADYYGDAPQKELYRPDWKPEEMTWYQVYETVSEGTPVTPPFETREELVEYLVANGDFADQKRRLEPLSSIPCDPWTREEATRFVFEAGWTPSLVVLGGDVMTGVQALAGTNGDPTND